MIWLASVGWLLIVIGVAGEGVAEALVSKADGLIETFNEIVVTGQQHEIAQAEGLAGNARTSSSEAASAAKSAVEAGKVATDLARSARQEADRFADDIKSAKEQAAKAESDLAEARRGAIDTLAELNRLKSPRTVANVSDFVNTMTQFKETEYTFSSVFEDEESINLLKIMDDALILAGWKRVKPPSGFPAINVYGSTQDFAVPAALTNGLRISVDWPGGLTPELRALPIDKLPGILKVAVSLHIAIFSHLSPPEEHPQPVDVENGQSKTVRLSVGKKL